jgi:hypothetical protein
MKYASTLSMPTRSVAIDPMSQALVPCIVMGPSDRSGTLPLRMVVAESLGSLIPETHIPSTLVEIDREVVIPVTNFGNESMCLGEF